MHQLFKHEYPSKEIVFAKFLATEDTISRDFISSIPQTLSEVVERIMGRSSAYTTSPQVLLNRTKASKSIFKFHEQANTLTDEVTDAINKFSLPETVMICSAHQPNLFAYSGVFKKSLLLQTEKEYLVEHDLTKQSIVNLFVIIDHDFIDDPWVHKAQLPSFHSRSCSVDIRVPLKGKQGRKMICNFPPPSRSTLDNWKNQIRLWIRKSCFLEETSDECKNQLLNRLESFWSGIVEDAYSHARSYADFNAFIISLLINSVWRKDVLFVRLSDILPVLSEGLEFLIANHKLYSSIIRNTYETFSKSGVENNVSPLAYEKAPVWLHCQCGSKAIADIKISNEGEVILEGSCQFCKRIIVLSVGQKDFISLSPDVLHLLSPKAIPLIILLARDLGMVCYASGLGAMDYMMCALRVFKVLSIPSPNVVFWPSRDVYTGLAQKAAIKSLGTDEIFLDSQLKDMEKLNQEYAQKIYKLIERKDWLIRNSRPVDEILRTIGTYKEQQRFIRQYIKEAEKAKRVLNLFPCIIDYAINFNLSDIAEQWRDNLLNKDNNNLFSPSCLRSATFSPDCNQPCNGQYNSES